MAPKKGKLSKLSRSLKGGKNSAQEAQQAPLDNPVFRGWRTCAATWIEWRNMGGAVHPLAQPTLRTQHLVVGDWGKENVDPPLGLLKDILHMPSCSVEGWSVHFGHFHARPFLASIFSDGVLYAFPSFGSGVPFTSLAHQAQSMCKLRSLWAQCSSADA